MKKIILFENKIELEKFSFLNEKRDDEMFFVFEEFLFFHLDDFEKFSKKNFAYKDFKKIDFNFFFNQMLTILIDLGFSEFLNFFYSQKKQVKKIFDDFWKSFERKRSLCAFERIQKQPFCFEEKSEYIKSFFQNLEQKFSESEIDDQFFQICQKIFSNLFIKLSDKNIYFHEKIIYKNHFNICLLFFNLDVFGVLDFDFEKFFSFLKEKFKEISLHRDNSFQNYFKKKLVFDSFFAFN